jgi:hypothetical protein
LTVAGSRRSGELGEKGNLARQNVEMTVGAAALVGCPCSLDLKTPGRLVERGF